MDAIVSMNFLAKTNLDTPTQNEESQICQRKVFCKFRVIAVLTQHSKIKTDRMGYEEGEKEIDSSRNIKWVGEQIVLKIRTKTQNKEQKVESREGKQKIRVWKKAYRSEKRKSNWREKEKFMRKKTERIHCNKNHKNIKNPS